MNHAAGGEDLQSITSHVTQQSRWLQVWWGCPPVTLWIHRLEESHLLSRENLSGCLSLFKQLSSQKFERENAGDFLLPSGFLLMQDLAQMRPKLMRHTRGGSVWRHLPRFVRTALWSSPLFVYDHGVRSEALYTNAAFQQVKCSCSSGSGKSLQFDLR